MNTPFLRTVRKRKFLAQQLEINSWDDVKPYADVLELDVISSENELEEWLLKRSELDSFLEEEKAWLYIRQSCDTENNACASAFTGFVEKIDAPYQLLTDRLNRKLHSFCTTHNYTPSLDIYIRQVAKRIEIFNEKNVDIEAGLEIEEKRYGAITGAMTVFVEDREITLQQAQNFLKLPDRELRKRIFEQIVARRLQDVLKLNDLYDLLIQKRNELALNAGFTSYIPFRFAQLGRFDYSASECEAFHNSVKQLIVPLVEKLQEKRRNVLGLNTLFPFDLDVDLNLKPPLKVFESISDLIAKTIACFNDIDPGFGEYIDTMHSGGYLDLDSRKGKAPGGYNYPLYESNVSFIFMNATDSLRDLTTMMHEGGHAIHSFLSRTQPLVYFKEVPAEMAELASMSMELISMEHWHYFFHDEDDLKRARQIQLEGIITALPWIAAIDQFQHQIYANPFHSHSGRNEIWRSIYLPYCGSGLNWKGYEDYFGSLWQKQIHLFQFPLYYIEYGIAQLGAIAVWKNYKEDPQKTIYQFRDALSKGYTLSLPKLYEAAGIRFDFSAEYLAEIIGFVNIELSKLEG
jgi:oligoendopeptidase F